MTTEVKKIIIIALAILAILAMVVVFISGCRKDITVKIPVKAPAITRTVSFLKDLVPIFKTSCAMSGCHTGGGRAPDLSADKAYKELIDGKFIDKSNPENSILFKRLTGKLTPVMPIGAPINPSNLNALVLAWIKQGAKKN